MESHSPEDHPYDQRRHRPGTKGASGHCTIPGCGQAPVISRHWQHDAYPNGWVGSYCRQHSVS